MFQVRLPGIKGMSLNGGGVFLMRFVRTFLSLGFLLFGAVVVLLAVGGYLTATGRSVPVMRSAIQRFGEVSSGQQLGQMGLSVSVDPLARRLDGTARLAIKAVGAERERVYLLLNDGLSISEVWAEVAPGQRTPLRHYRLWLLTVIALEDVLPDAGELTLGISYGGDPLGGWLPFGQRVIEADEIILTPSSLWYPTDMKSFFRADVEVTLPASLDVVHSGSAEIVTDLGSSRRTRWSSVRPANGVSLVAGRFAAASHEDAGVQHRAFVGAGIDLDSDRIVDSMARAFRQMSEDYGALAASRQTVFVSRRLQRAFADGAGVVGLPPEAFSRGDYGFAAVAEGIARTWWGGTVAAQSTDPKSGGAWAIEGFAANAARMAVRERFGEDAEFRWRQARTFDPTSVGVLADASFLQDERDPAAGEGTRNKAALVFGMLQELVGRDAYLSAARSLVERYHNSSVTNADVREAFSAASKIDLESFFDQWVDTIEQVDLSLDPKDGGADVVNHQTAEFTQPIEIWRVPPGGEPIRQKIAIGQSTPMGNAERIVVDPRGVVVDMYRANNVLPREVALRSISRSRRGSWMIVEGEPYEWAPAKVREIDQKGQTRHVWDFNLGLRLQPRWSADGTRIYAVEPPRGDRTKLFVLQSGDGTQIPVGYDDDVDGGAAGYVAVRKGRLLMIAGDESKKLARIQGGEISLPRISPDGLRVLYAADRGTATELHLIDVESDSDRILMTWPERPLIWEWSPDSKVAYAILPGDWDRQLWQLPKDGTPRALAREAAAVRAMEISPDGKRVALAAQAKVDYSFERYEVFVVDPSDRGGLKHFTVSGLSVVDLSWFDNESLIVIGSDPTYSMTPPQRALRLLKLADGSVVDFPQ